MAPAPTHPAPSAHAAGFVAKALIHTHPSEREAVMVSIMQHAAEGLRVIRGREEAAEAIFRLADEMVARGRA